MNQFAETPPAKPKLGLMGASMNAMALIAPGAFLWITYQLQAGATLPSGVSCANDMWAGVLVASILCLFTALAYAELARIYPEAGFAGVVYFAEKAWLDAQGKKRAAATSLARISKLATGWAAHLFYWVYPGVMTAMMATMVGYIYTAFTGQTMSTALLFGVAVVFAFTVGLIAYRGITGSTAFSIGINVIQWAALAVFGLLAIYYRLANPQHAAAWAFSGAFDIVKFHNIQGVLVQSTIAILILVGFESCTSLSAETEKPEKNIPRAILLALVVQCFGAYGFGYLATNMMVSEKLTGTVAAAAAVPAHAVSGLDAMAASSAPIGDMAVALVGNWFMILMAFTVAIAVFGTTLSCMNTAVRVTNGMANDRELPRFLRFIHSKFSTPHTTIWLLVVVSSFIAAIGIQSTVYLLGITLASNLGTFVLYGLTCVWTFVAFKDRKDFSVIRHAIVPLAGLIMNLVMCWGILYLNAIGTADNKTEFAICWYISGGFALLTFLYVVLTTVLRDYSMKMITAFIRPESLDDLVEALQKENLVNGMTVTEVRGFGRQHGAKAAGERAEKIKFLAKIRVDIAVNDWDVPPVMDTMQEILNTGKAGDGKIFVYDATEAVRIRTGEMGVVAV